MINFLKKYWKVILFFIIVIILFIVAFMLKEQLINVFSIFFTFLLSKFKSKKILNELKDDSEKMSDGLKEIKDKTNEIEKKANNVANDVYTININQLIFRRKKKYIK